VKIALATLDTCKKNGTCCTNGVTARPRPQVSHALRSCLFQLRDEDKRNATSGGTCQKDAVFDASLQLGLGLVRLRWGAGSFGTILLLLLLLFLVELADDWLDDLLDLSLAVLELFSLAVGMFLQPVHG